MSTNNLMGATSALPDVLVNTQISSAAETNVYQVAALNAVKVAKVVISNNTALPVTVGVSLCKSGQTASAATRQIPAAFTLDPNDWRDCTEYADQFMGPGAFFSVIPGTANAITFVMSGVVFS